MLFLLERDTSGVVTGVVSACSGSFFFLGLLFDIKLEMNHGSLFGDLSYVFTYCIIYGLLHELDASGVLLLFKTVAGEKQMCHWVTLS